MGDKKILTLPANVSSLPKGRAFIEAACHELSVDDNATYDILLAVDEVLSNIIEHGYAGLQPGEMVIAWRLEGSQFIVDIIDFGHVFEPHKPEQPDLQAIFDAGRQGGLGLFMVYHIMDKVSYHTSDRGNTMTLVKEIKGS